MIKITVKATLTPPVTLHRLQYVLSFLQQHPAAPSDVIFEIQQHEQENYTVNDYSIFCNRQYFHLPVLQQMPRANCFQWQDKILLAIGQSDDSCSIRFDIFETIFFLISRYEEWFCNPATDHDKYNMLLTWKHFLVQQNLHRTPVVDYLVLFFYTKIGLSPTSNNTIFQLSHDIDAIKKYPSFYKFIRSIAHIFVHKKGNFSTILKLFRQYFRQLLGKEKDVFDTFEWLLRENTFFSKKVIYFLCGGITKYDNFFDIRDKYLQTIFDNARKYGYIIGLHPSFATWKNKTLFEKELAELQEVTQQKITHTRQHFLRFAFGKTSEIIDDLNFTEDGSLGYQDKIGFRCGTGFAYKLYNFISEKPYKFLTQPLAIMDSALLQEVGNDIVEFEKQFVQFAEQNQQHTCIHINFHNSTFDDAMLDANRLRQFYLQLGN